MPSSVTVLMAVHNGERFIERALDSLRAQTWRQFQAIVIDDGSTDATSAILSGLADPRFSVHRNPDNLGLTRSLNRGLRLIHTDYVARLDADDVALPGRLAAQVAYLDQHPELGIVGSDCEVVDENDRLVAVYAYPRSHTAIRWRHFFNNGFCHSSVMLRRSILERNQLCYDERIRYAQDFDLWTRLLRHTRGTNLGTPLVRWRTHARSISSQRQAEQAQFATDVVLREMSNLLGRAVDSDLARELKDWYSEISICRTDTAWRTALLAMELLEALAACSDLDPDELGSIHGDWLVGLSRRMPMARWHLWAQAELFRRRALPHWPRLAYRAARHVWRRGRAQMSLKR